ncbi:DUF1700 domain-containing protein [Ammoniphilus resinae]|uniref:DUF1700 domain-containing protein n=1 Tax=Ammoniphilus resinae TaxID=861532 RepID=A0ABS4GS87_9BACL|nr:hypothetical protein [Ammoniphilus resinae]
MKKEEWLQQVKEQLKGLPKESREKVLEQYEELFQIAKANGKEEDEIIEVLNDRECPEKQVRSCEQIEPQRLLIVFLILAIGSIITGMALEPVFIYSPMLGWSLGMLFLGLSIFYAVKRF